MSAWGWFRLWNPSGCASPKRSAVAVPGVTTAALARGGSWLAVFGKIAAAIFYILAVSTLVLPAAWVVAYRRRALSHLKGSLAGSTILTGIAWVVVLDETRISDFIMTLM